MGFYSGNKAPILTQGDSVVFVSVFDSGVEFLHGSAKASGIDSDADN